MRFLMVGDVIGQPGRRFFARVVPKLKQQRQIDLVVVNGENAAGGRGLTRACLDELVAAGADVITSGNHIWDNRDVMQIIDDEPYLLRPANYPPGTPGHGWCVYELGARRVAVVNLAGRAFMPPIDCPFQRVEEVLAELKGRADFILLDFHAETTSEKSALGWYLDGRVTAVCGTHTHVQTADERLLPRGTAYISDLGMVGPYDSVIGDEVSCIVQKFTTGLPVRFNLAKGPCIFSAALITAGDDAGRAVAIERIRIGETPTASP